MEQIAAKKTKSVENIFDSKSYKRSRKAYAAQCTFEYFVAILVSDAFLAKLLTYIGIRDSYIGIISSLVSFAFLFQLLSVFLMQRIKNVKKTVLIFNTMSQLFFLSIYLIPFLSISRQAKTVLVIIGILLAYFGNYLIVSVLFKWANSYVEPWKRGEYSAIKEMISLFGGMLFTIAIGYVIDYYEGIGNIRGGFLFIAVSMLVLNICNLISVLLIRNSAADRSDIQRKSLGDVMCNIFGNKKFVAVIVMTVMWETARYMTLGFMGTFKTNDLMLSMGTVQIINMAANLFRMIFSKPFGRYSDTKSYAAGYKLALIIAAVGFAINIFATPKTWWCVILFTVFYFVSLAGTNQNSFNITYSYVKNDYIVQAMAVKSCIGGIFGFAASLVGGRILTWVQNNGNMFLGIKVYGQQMLSVISLILITAAVMFTHFVVEKQEIIKQ